MTIFGKQPILLPKNCDLSKWAVIACDQYTTNMKYWQELYDYIGDAPSTLHITFPEIFLKDADIQPRIDKINAEMRRYTKNGFFKEIPGMILVERTLPSGKKRIGLIIHITVLLRRDDQRPSRPCSHGCLVCCTGVRVTT